MGDFHCTITVSPVTGPDSRRTEAIVDSGASYSVIPARLLNELGIQPKRSDVFMLADGTRHEEVIGEARVAVNGRDAVTPVVFGSDEALPLLGAVTMQELNLVVDTKGERLVPGVAYLL